MPTRPLVVTENDDLLEDILRLSAVAGVEPLVADPGAARAAWRGASLVLVGADQVGACAHIEPVRRSGVVVVCRGQAELPVWVSGLRLGADQVLELPAAERTLVELLAAAGAAPTGPPGPVLCVLAGRGGAGASVLAAALAVVAARSGGSPMLVDVDPLGGGLDVLLGAEGVGGLRWTDLVGSAGRLSPAALRAGLPEAGGVRMLSAGRDGPIELPAVAVRAVLEAGRQCADPVIVDVSGAVGAAAEVALGEAARALLVVPGELRAVAAADRMAAWARRHTGELGLVVRGGPTGSLAAAEISQALGLPVLGELRDEPGLAGALERGEPPGRRARGPLARLCGRLLAELPERALR
ncbi:MAG TPA: septum site-determining protein Ssd [Mycobacteriales bacterium]|nr:septum site-determining protein Ssd [Mycobacteriales bacterium]